MIARQSRKNKVYLKLISFSFFVLTLSLTILSLNGILTDSASLYSGQSHLDIPSELTITYENLTAQEITRANEAVGSLSPKFLLLQSNLAFVRDISPYCDNCSGVNMNNGQNIYVEMQDNPILLKYILCHELLHTYLTTIDHDLEEELVAHVSKRLVCFENIVTDKDGNGVIIQ